MPILDNPRHELFAQAIAEGKSATEAYASAGYSPNDGNAIRLKGIERVSARVKELLIACASQTKVTIEGITEELELARVRAMEASQVSAAVSAIMGKAKLHGLIVDKKQHSGPTGGAIPVIDVSRLRGMTNEQLQLLDRTLVQLGLADGEGDEGADNDDK